VPRKGRPAATVASSHSSGSSWPYVGTVGRPCFPMGTHVVQTNAALSLLRKKKDWLEPVCG